MFQAMVGLPQDVGGDSIPHPQRQALGHTPRFGVWIAVYRGAAPSGFVISGSRRGGTHAGLMLAARITLAHFSVSSAMNLPKPAGDSFA
jgi:hypothetical protein